MKIDWGVFSTIAAPIIALLFGIWIDRRFGDHVKLVSFYGHVSSFRHTPPNGEQLIVNTHAVVLRNAGRQAATNVRLSHNFLPDFNIVPAVNHTIQPVPGGVTDIVIPTLVPGEQIVVSYLYFPPQTAADINAGIKCDQGFCQQINVLLQRQWPGWLSKLATIMVIVGFLATLYVIYDVVMRVILIVAH